MANPIVMDMDMVMAMAMATAILKMNKEKNGGNFGNRPQSVVYCTLDELCKKFNLPAG